MIYKIFSCSTYLPGISLTCVGALSLQSIAVLVGVSVCIGTFFVNWYYRRKSYLLLKETLISREVFDELNR